MASFNKVILVGNLTRDPELRYTPKGTAIAKIGLAVNRVWTNEAGEKKEEVTFVDVDAFGKTAETIGQYLKKGRPILIEGRLRYQTWEDKQSGQKKISPREKRHDPEASLQCPYVCWSWPTSKHSIDYDPACPRWPLHLVRPLRPTHDPACCISVHIILNNVFVLTKQLA